MSINRLLLVLLAALLLPGLALAQSRATFAVTKDFRDGNTVESATVTITCNTGLPLTQSKAIKDTGGVGVTFIVESYGPGMNCDVTEAVPFGYTNTEAVAGGTGSGISSDTTTKCTFTNVGNGDAKTCLIWNAPTPVDVTVYKEWVLDGQGGNSVDSFYTIRLNCGSSEIIGGNAAFIYDSWRASQSNSVGTDDDYYTFSVVPKWDGSSSCSVYEDTVDSAIDTTSDCGSGAIHPVLGGGGDDSCTFTNTVFFEGIPTLSQYGMAIMALLMLGVGFVGFRRLV